LASRRAITMEGNHGGLPLRRHGGVKVEMKGGLGGISAFVVALGVVMVAFAVGVSLGLGCAADQLAVAAPFPSGESRQEESLSRINLQLTDPLSSIWSLTLKNSNTLLNSPHAWNPQVKFESVLPVPLTKDWTLVTRPVFKFFDSKPYVNSEGYSTRETGMGDSTLTMVLSPNSSNWLFGVGPAFVLPTATTQETGNGKWQAGPAAVFGYRSERVLLAVYPQQWWSFAGQGDRSSTSKLELQYFYHYFLDDGWSIGASPTITANWESSSGQKLTFPVGLGVGKVVKICGVPVKFGIEGQYMIYRPDSSGKEWNLEFTISPRLPPLLQEILF